MRSIKLLFTFGSLFFLCSFMYFWTTVLKKTSAKNTDVTKVNNANVHAEKWIVITSVSYPTGDIKKMAELKNWKIVVVADKKTPPNWNFTNCIFLSVEMQEKLNYHIMSLIPYKSYTRKMVGYLYAIEHGAKYIYDTDDDNLPIKMGLDAFDYTKFSSGLVYRKSNVSDDRVEFYNVYSHFGRPDVWPRGYPLELISDDKKPMYYLCGNLKTPIVQQGLVDQDADVDAIYRMIYVKNKKTGLNVKFDEHAPSVVLPENTFCPFNSQNTLFHYDAFWALLLPVTVTFRVTDIWRGYWAQKLLHLSGNNLAFYPPNARQYRNPHNYLLDYLEETQLYAEASKLVDSFRSWKCKSTVFSQCIIELSRFMASRNFWGKGDEKLTEAWINDLSKIAYTFPTVASAGYLDHARAKCLPANFVSTMAKSLGSKLEIEQYTLKLSDLCQPFSSVKLINGSSYKQFNRTRNVVLIVTIRTSDFTRVPLLQLIYEPWFANVIFCSDFRETSTENDKFSYINLNAEEINADYFNYMCLKKVSEMKYSNVDGYTVIADDSLLNFWNPFDLDRINFPTECSPSPSKSSQWLGNNGEPALKKLIQMLNNISSIENISDILFRRLRESILDPVHCVSKVYYIPQKHSRQYKILSQLFFDHKVSREIALPKILHLLGWANNSNLSSHTFYKNQTTFGSNYSINKGSNISSNNSFLHTMKWSLLNNAEWQKTLCQTVFV